MMSMKITSESKKTLLRVRGASNKYQRTADLLSETFAKSVLRNVKLGIQMQTFGHHPLSTRWKEEKARLGLDPRILIATRDYIRFLRVKKLRSGQVAITGDLELAKKLEYGTKTMKARPHWTPTIRRVLKEMNLTMGGKIADALFAP
jgi:hypothetical protein